MFAQLFRPEFLVAVNTIKFTCLSNENKSSRTKSLFIYKNKKGKYNFLFILHIQDSHYIL